jgi:pimeloyl-ACP methyl ester carboxylesterase
MTTFLLVHGTSQAGWTWKFVAQRLQALGHDVYRPTLDGCAERKVGLRPGITLASQGAELAGVLFYEDLEDVVCVATSSGGMVLCEAAQQVPERIRQLIFVDAIVPLPGETAPMINSRPDTPLEQLVYGPPPEQARGRVYADLEPELQDWALARYTQHPLAPTELPVDLRKFWSLQWRADVLRCTGSVRPTEEHQRRTARLLGGSYAEIDSGHYPMLTHADELTDYLLARSAVAFTS